jgi:predicted enzyme related to lactoylglutathione lyase
VKQFDSMITFCFTNDMEATHRFYGEILELPIILEQTTCRIYRAACDACIGFCSETEKPPCGNVTITLVTDDVDQWFERIAKAGYEVVKPPASAPEYSIYNCFVKDPSGCTVEIQRFEDARWLLKK